MSDKIEITKDLENVSNAVAEINATETGIAELKKKYESVVFDVSTTAGMTEAKQARAEIREPRYNIENLRKAAKSPILALGRSLDARARELTERILELETPVDDVIKAEEQRKAEEKRKAAEAEKERIDEIKARIADMFDGVNQVTSDHKMSSESVDLAISGFQQLQIDDSFAEFKDDAQRTYDTCLELLEKHSEAMAEREAEEKRQAERDAELEQLRKEKEARDAADAVAEKKRLAEEQRKADIKAELDRKAAEVKPIEEQLATTPWPVEGVVVGHKPKPYVIEDTVVAAVTPDPSFPPYPGAHELAVAIGEHLGVNMQTAKHWLARYAADFIEELKA